MDLTEITPLLITLDEQENLPRTLAALSWARRIVVVDSGSTDRTLEILRTDSRVVVLERPFDRFAEQCTFGLGQVKTPWVLSLDADHITTPALRDEIESLPDDDADGFEIPFRYCIQGRPLRGTLLPPRIALFRRERGRYENDGHGHRVCIEGRVRRLNSPLLHDDRKPLDRWLQSQIHYSRQEADKLLAAPFRSLGWADRLRRLYLAPWLVMPFCLLVKGLILDGRAGLAYAAQRFAFETLLMLRLLHARLRAPL